MGRFSRKFPERIIVKEFEEKNPADNFLAITDVEDEDIDGTLVGVYELKDVQEITVTRELSAPRTKRKRRA